MLADVVDNKRRWELLACYYYYIYVRLCLNSYHAFREPLSVYCRWQYSYLCSWVYYFQCPETPATMCAYCTRYRGICVGVLRVIIFLEVIAIIRSRITTISQPYFASYYPLRPVCMSSHSLFIIQNAVWCITAELDDIVVVSGCCGCGCCCWRWAELVLICFVHARKYVCNQKWFVRVFRTNIMNCYREWNGIYGKMGSNWSNE